MLAMQYSIHLPHNTGADEIRERVRQRRALFDNHQGLMHKAFLYNEQDHLYAPFYIWRDLEQGQRFLMADLFKGVIETFSRHRVRSWFVLSAAYGNQAVLPGYALREVDAIPAELALDRFAEEEQQIQQKMLENPNLYIHAVAFDADRWELLRYSLWKDKASAAKPMSDCYQAYEVLHISEPETPIKGA